MTFREKNSILKSLSKFLCVTGRRYLRDKNVPYYRTWTPRSVHLRCCTFVLIFFKSERRLFNLKTSMPGKRLPLLHGTKYKRAGTRDRAIWIFYLKIWIKLLWSPRTISIPSWNTKRNEKPPLRLRKITLMSNVMLYSFRIHMERSLSEQHVKEFAEELRGKVPKISKSQALTNKAI